MPNGGWASSDRRSRLPADWHKRRARTYRAAHGRCQATLNDGTPCDTIAPLHKTATSPAGHADHIDRDLGEDGPLQWLCQPCHLRKSSTEGHDAARAQRSKLLHPTERHPGLR